MIRDVPRRVLVVATQCAAEKPLERLGTAANSLYAVLTDPHAGAAEGHLLCGPANKTGIESAIATAIAQAALDRAVLILAFLGHGFVLPDDRTLYYMASDTEPDSPASGVHVGRLLSEAAVQPGVAGVIGIVDTCFAGTAVPDPRSLVGRVECSVLMSAAADQRAYRMECTFALVELLTSGTADSTEVVYVDDELIGRLRDRVPAQSPARLNYDGGSTSGQLWLARNTGRGTGTAGSIGPLGLEDLDSAIQTWHEEYPKPDTWTPATLQKLRETVEQSGALGRHNVLRVIDALSLAVEAAEFLSSASTIQLTTEKLRTSARRAGIRSPTGLTGWPLLIFLLEYAVLRSPVVSRSPSAPLAKFVAALMIATSTPRDDPLLRRWTKKWRLDTEVNDAFDALDATPDRTQLRLVLSLADGFTAWPDSVQAWLLRPGETPTPQTSFPCSTRGRPATEDAIRKALDWAAEASEPGETPRYVDIAAPAHLLAEWRPERADVGLYDLGAEHNVLAQWSGRLQPGSHLKRINDSARRAWQAMDEHPDVPLVWVTRDDLHDVRAFAGHLRAGRMSGLAIGLDHRPAHLAEVLGLLLPYSPVLVWPGSDDVAGDPWPDVVCENWDVLPHELSEAFRTWSLGRATALAHVRCAWHDRDWLEFCRRFECRVVQAP